MKPKHCFTKQRPFWIYMPSFFVSTSGCPNLQSMLWRGFSSDWVTPSVLRERHVVTSNCFFLLWMVIIQRLTCSTRTRNYMVLRFKWRNTPGLVRQRVVRGIRWDSLSFPLWLFLANLGRDSAVNRKVRSIKSALICIFKDVWLDTISGSSKSKLQFWHGNELRT